MWKDQRMQLDIARFINADPAVRIKRLLCLMGGFMFINNASRLSPYTNC